MEDDNGPGPKRFKPNHSNSEPEKELESTVASSNDIALLNTENIEDTDTPLDDPEIKVVTISAGNIEEIDPLQIKENCRDSTKSSSKMDQVCPSKPRFQICPVAMDGIKNGTGPIFLKKVAKPPESLLKKIKPQTVITLKYGEKLVAVQEINKKYPRKSEPVVAPVDGHNRPDNRCFTLSAQEPNKDIVGTSADKKNEKQSIMKYQKRDNKDNVCVVEGCPGNATHFFMVPNDWRRINIWRYCLNNQKLVYGNFICDQHFIKEDLQITPKGVRIGVLNPFAVPSSQKVLVGCCFSQCFNRTQNTATMYPIPIWGNYQLWLRYMGNVNMKKTKVHDLLRYRVCDRHFFKPNPEKWHQLTPTKYLPPLKQQYLNKLQDDIESRAVEEDQNEFCTYLGCKLNKKNSHFMFHKFPTDYDMAIKWIRECYRPDILKKTPMEIEKFIKDSIGVCFNHKNAIEKNIRKREMYFIRLNEQQTETSNHTYKVYQGKTEVDKSGDSQESEPMIVDLTEENANPSDSNQQLIGEKSYVPSTDYCAFINCSTFKKDLVKKYRFPADNELLAQWIEATAIPKMLSEDTIRTLFVCGKHFNESQYTKRGTLILSSVPAPHTEFVDSSSHEGNEHWIIKQKKTQKIYTGSSSSNERSKCTVRAVYKHGYSTVVTDKRPALSDALALAALQEDKDRVEISEDGADSVNAPEDECVVKGCIFKKFINNRLYNFPIENQYKFINWIKAVENTSIITEELSTAYLNKKICQGHFEKRFKIGRQSTLMDDAVPTLYLVPDGVEVKNQVKDTTIKWQECTSDICDTDVPDSRALYFKGYAELHRNSIEFPNIKRELRFGKHCQRYGPMHKFPFKLFRMAKKNIGGEAACVRDGHKVQIHTAIIVDDDDQSEKDAVKLLSQIIMDNDKLAPKRGSRGWDNIKVVPTKKENI